MARSENQDTPVLEEAARPEPPANADTNNRGNFTRNLNQEADESIARKMFFGGLAFLPWLHLVNVFFYRKQLMDATVDAKVTLCTYPAVCRCCRCLVLRLGANVKLWDRRGYAGVRRSLMGFCLWTVLFLAWVLIFQLNWKSWGWESIIMVVPDEDVDVGCVAHPGVNPNFGRHQICSLPRRNFLKAANEAADRFPRSCTRGLLLSAAMSAPILSIDTQHEDMIHDAQLDYYGKRLATCSSDRTIKVYDVTGDVQNNEQILTGCFGVLLAACSYDGKVIIYREQSLNQWTQAYVHAFHDASVNSIAWAPHEYGLSLACASADGTVSDSALGCNAVSWAPFNSVGSQGPSGPIRRVVTASCDKTIKIWSLAEGETEWLKQELSSAPAHSDWVRDVAWAPSTGLPVNLIASCSEDKHVYIWSQSAEDSAWKRELLHTFDAPVWRVSWSVTGNVLAVSSGDHKVTLWKETLDKKWIQISSVDEAGAIHNGE
ncbi:hypothetical protein BBJ28_00006790 [Nothophytophthora sp. Chile5]|nr:hypothetical protein BBJ28_00006790 [Nothophytophthora sp. Chile5]